MLSKPCRGMGTFPAPNVATGLPEELEIQSEEIVARHRVKMNHEDGENRGDQGLEPRGRTRARTTTATPTRRAMYLKRLTINVWRTFWSRTLYPRNWPRGALREEHQPQMHESCQSTISLSLSE